MPLNPVSNKSYIICPKFKIEMALLSSRHLYNIVIHQLGTEVNFIIL